MMLAPVATSPTTSSLGWLSPYSPKTLPKEARIDHECDPHNNTVRMAISAAQVDAYSPIEDRMYVNDKDNLFAIFDGHGGDICSRYVVDKLPKQILSCLKKQKSHCDYNHLLKTCFMHVDEQFLTEHKYIVKTSPAGSCGVSVLIRNDTLYVCNVGDSRVLLGSKGEQWSHTLLTNDHNTKNERERQLVRTRSSDPLPMRTGISSKEEGDRIGGILMLTRAFGDGIFKRRDMSLHPLIQHLPYITSEPEITTHKLAPTDKYVVISSDGLYEHLTPAQVAEFVEQQLESGADPITIAPKILELQFEVLAKLMNKPVEQVKKLSNRKMFMDDTTVIVLVFKDLIAP